MARTLIVWGLLGATAVQQTAVAAKSSARIARSCRQGIAHAFEQLARLGFRELDACEKQKRASGAALDCTVLRSGEGRSTRFRRWEYRTRQIVTVRCPLDTPARDSFPVKEFSADVIAGDPTQVVPTLGATVEASARELQGGGSSAVESGVVTGDTCMADVAAARSLVATATMRHALGCQRRLDRSATVFGPLDPGCEGPPPDAAIREAAGLIAGACRGATGPEVGTCSGLPSCAIEHAIETGLALARLTFGQCGNGVLDGDEECDDGNPIADDGCDRCKAPQCGNGKVEGDEECDDGNGLDHDGCTACRLPVCGDGILDVGAEACDDGNAIPFDGCTDCQSDPVACSSAGVLATVTIDYDPAQFVDVAGMRVRIRYPPEALSLPGSLVGASISQRVTNLTGLTIGTFTVADRDLVPSEDAPDGVDDTLQTLVAVPSGRVPPGPFEQIRFDCGGAEARASQLECFVENVVDPFLNQVPDDVTAEHTHCSVILETAPVE
jgi:cysteine-rich repeat protein